MTSSKKSADHPKFLSSNKKKTDWKMLSTIQSPTIFVWVESEALLSTAHSNILASRHFFAQYTWLGPRPILEFCCHIFLKLFPPQPHLHVSTPFLEQKWKKTNSNSPSPHFRSRTQSRIWSQHSNQAQKRNAWTWPLKSIPKYQIRWLEIGKCGEDL